MISERNLKLSIINDSSALPREIFRAYVYKAVHPLHVSYSNESIASFFMEGLAAIDDRKGTLFCLSDKDIEVAYALILHGYPSEKGAPHLHIFSVPSAHQNKGIGREFLRLLLPRLSPTQDISAECVTELLPFFYKAGFKLKHLSEDKRNAYIHFGNSPEKDNFFRPGFIGEGFDRYFDEYQLHQASLRRARLMRAQ